MWNLEIVDVTLLRVYRFFGPLIFDSIQIVFVASYNEMTYYLQNNITFTIIHLVFLCMIHSTTSHIIFFSLHKEMCLFLSHWRLSWFWCNGILVCTLLSVSAFPEASIFIHPFSKPGILIQQTVLRAWDVPPDPVRGAIRMGWYSCVWFAFASFGGFWSEYWSTWFWFLYLFTRWLYFDIISVWQNSFDFVIDGVLNIRLVVLE